MHSTPDHALLMEALSDMLLRRHESALWRTVFLGSSPVPVSFHRTMLTLISTDAPRHGWQQAELARLAERFDGWCEPVGASGASSALLCFPEGGPALRAALLLQKIGAETQVRAAVTGGICTLACIDVDGGSRRLMLLSEDLRAEAALQLVPPGQVVISPEIYDELEPLLAAEAGVLVATEFDTESVAHASITLLPPASSLQSTFAGLGLC
jgi:hypothetical protein